MKLIIKNPEPQEWKDHRETDGASFTAIPPLRKALYDEQGGICAYCMCRLLDEHYQEHGLVSNAAYIGNPENLERITNVVEHFECRNNENLLDYTNLVMCCSGVAYNENYIRSIHCDEAKGNQTLSFKLTDTAFIDTISYNSEGKIISSNDKFQVEFDTVLKLNDPMLEENRSRVYKAVTNKVKGNKWTESKIRKFLTFLESRDENNLFLPYCGVSISFVKRKMIANGIKI